MIRLGRDEMVSAPHLSVDERIEKIEPITVDDVQRVAAEILTGPRVIGAVGPFEPEELSRYAR
jgi:predicted Zn-dependent peptidase